MANFSNKLLGLVGAVVVFTGMAYGQNTISCATLAPSQVTFIRAEGQTELIPTLTLGCTNTAATAGVASITVFFSPTVTVTSAFVTGSTTNTEATATLGATNVAGTLNSGAVVFSNIAVPATAGAFNIILTNIRVNATQIPVTAGAAPTALSVLAFLSGTNVVPGPAPTTGTATTVAYVTNGLQASKFGSTNAVSDSKVVNASNSSNGLTSATSSFGVCGSQNSSTSATANPDFYISINAGFQTAFKTITDETNGGATPINGDVAASGTRVKVVFTNVPAGLNLYLPVTLTATNTTTNPTPPPATVPVSPLPTLQAVVNEVGAKVLQTAVTTPAQFSLVANGGALVPVAGSSGGVFQVPISNGTGTAVYEVTIDNLTVTPTFVVPVYFNASSNGVTVQSSALTVQTSFAPITAATTIPSFAVLASSSPTLSVLSFTQCTTSLLFPFVTNAAGFETGIAIDNTTKDPFGTKGQTGTCTLNFYGTGGTNPTAGAAPNPNEGAGQPYLAGESYAFTLTSALAAASATNPATFTGYVIAQCTFQDAHAFAYITYGFPGTSSDTMGYLALVLARGSTSPESLGE